MKEVDLVLALVRKLAEKLPGAVVFKHADTMTAGIPDISVTWGGVTTWLEVKYANPRIEHQEAQALIMARLRVIGRAYYVIYDEPTRTIRVTAPGDDFTPLLVERGFKHEVVADFIRGRR